MTTSADTYRFYASDVMKSIVKIATNLTELLIGPPHDKTNKITVRPAKIQISLRIRPV